MKIYIRFVLLAVVILMILPSSYGQNSDDAKAVTETFLIKNATIFIKPGQSIQKGSILIEKGIIKEVSKEIKAPFNAQIIDADSMYVYPSLINTATHIAYKESEEKAEEADDPGNPTYEQAGIMPQHTIRDFYNAKDGSIENLRDMGFGYLHVLPKGRMLPGQGSIILATGKTFAEANLEENNSMYAQLRSASGVFPKTILGVMSQYRDLFKNAELNKKYAAQYRLKPAGLQRPEITPELIALHGVIDKSQRMFFKAESIKDIMRVIKLKQELGFNMVLTEVKHGAPIIDELKRHQFPILLSLDLPKEIKESDMGKDPSAEELALYEAKKNAYDLYVNQCKVYTEAGVPFSFSYLGVNNGDIKKNLVRILASGVTEETIMEGLTTRPAEVLGISSVAGTIEKGKLGNIFISDLPFFDEKSKVQWILLDGKLEKIKKKVASGEDNLKDVVGTWKYEIEIPGMTESGQIRIEKEGKEYAVGVSSSASLEEYADATNVVIDDNTMTFDLSINRDGMSLDLEYVLEFDNDTLNGTVTAGEFGTFSAEWDEDFITRIN